MGSPNSHARFKLEELTVTGRGVGQNTPNCRLGRLMCFFNSHLRFKLAELTAEFLSPVFQPK